MFFLLHLPDFEMKPVIQDVDFQGQPAGLLALLPASGTQLLQILA